MLTEPLAFRLYVARCVDPFDGIGSSGGPGGPGVPGAGSGVLGTHASGSGVLGAPPLGVRGTAPGVPGEQKTL